MPQSSASRTTSPMDQSNIATRVSIKSEGGFPSIRAACVRLSPLLCRRSAHSATKPSNRLHGYIHFTIPFIAAVVIIHAR